MAAAVIDDTTKTIRSIERAIDVLACFDHATPQLSVTDLQKRTGLSRPTLYRILATLTGKGVIRSFGEPQRFALGHEASRLGANWIGQDDFVRAARPVLTRLWKETGETVALFVAVEEQQENLYRGTAKYPGADIHTRRRFYGRPRDRCVWQGDAGFYG